MPVSGLRNKAVRLGDCEAREAFESSAPFFLIGEGGRDRGVGADFRGKFESFPMGRDQGRCLSEVRFGVRSRVPWVGDENSGGFRILTVSGLRNFSKIFLKKVWRIVKKQYFCGPVSRERGGRAREAEGTGAAGKKLFEKFFRKSLAVRKKDVLLLPQTERGGDRDGREAGDGARRKPGAMALEADAERRVH